MSVLVDSSVWSLAFRRTPAHLNQQERWRVAALTRLIEVGDAKLIGPIRQEVLTGIREKSVFERLRAELRNFLDEPIQTQDYETAAEMTNRCLSKGIGWGSIHVLICAVAKNREWELFSTDRDFERFSREFGISLFQNFRTQ